MSKGFWSLLRLVVYSILDVYKVPKTQNSQVIIRFDLSYLKVKIDGKDTNR